MIMLYSGTPGSGKSLHTARDIRDSLGAKRRPVIANYISFNFFHYIQQISLFY